MPRNLSKQQKMGVLLILSAAAEESKKNKKRFWMKKIYQKRAEYTQINNIMNDLNVIDFHTYLRMDSQLLEMLLGMVGPEIQRRDTFMRESVSAKERLLVTLRYLATGESYPELMVSYAVSPQLMSTIIPETCLAIYKALKDEYLKNFQFHHQGLLELKKIALLEILVMYFDTELKNSSKEPSEKMVYETIEFQCDLLM
ncbi:hypothetical protein ACJJTC_001842 [Scirpophaga incertulas]